MAPRIDAISTPGEDIRPTEGAVMTVADQDLVGRFRKLELPRSGAIQCTAEPPNVNNNSLPNHGNRAVNMISFDEEYDLEGTIMPVGNTEAFFVTSPTAPIITVQLKAPITVQTYQPRSVVTTVVAKKHDYDSRVVPWDYQLKGKAKMMETAVAHGMTRSGRCYVPEDLNRGSSGKEHNQRRNITNTEAAEFWKKIQTKDYSIEERLKKTPAQISIISLLMSSEAYRDALVKVLSGVSISNEMTSETLATTIGRMVEANKISFHDDELPPEGTEHHKALHITVRCGDKFVSRVLIYGGSGCNICPLNTLRSLKMNTREMKEIRMKVRAFDGTQRGVIGEICLHLQIGPMEFPILFQVMDISSTYNLLLGRPWVHMAVAVPSTLHQCLKFEWGLEQIVVQGELGHPVYSERSILIIEEMGELDGATFHAVEIMQEVRIDEMAGSNEMKMSSAAKMVASEMLKYGYQPKFGLGPKSNGIIEPIQLKQQKGTFGLGHDPTFGETSGTKGIFVPEKIPVQGQMIVPEVDEDIIEGMENLFVTMNEEYYGETEADAETPTIRDAEPGEILQNWTVSILGSSGVLVVWNCSLFSK
ncbi:uncharacterized protein LOC132644302 [Lycium barbarum]|uniref:uncharacterized protein LOC132644302 n=1 Tax=Lycium barbarum TaxID=112863 RepID=UPI00293EA47E|nr:uncharacterized protein LOC132644302 [Lycium barbarum]